jgi:hypothetical protein
MGSGVGLSDSRPKPEPTKPEPEPTPEPTKPPPPEPEPLKAEAISEATVGKLGDKGLYATNDDGIHFRSPWGATGRGRPPEAAARRLALRKVKKVVTRSESFRRMSHR